MEVAQREWLARRQLLRPNSSSTVGSRVPRHDGYSNAKYTHCLTAYAEQDSEGAAPGEIEHSTHTVHRFESHALRSGA